VYQTGHKGIYAPPDCHTLYLKGTGQQVRQVLNRDKQQRGMHNDIYLTDIVAYDWLKFS